MIDELLKEQKKLSQSKRWKAALGVNDKLINLDPTNADVFRERSRYFRRLDDIENATEAMEKFLELKCGYNICELLHMINSELKEKLNVLDISSTYKVTSSGGFNFGVFEHQTENGDMLFTKIATKKVGDAERNFYKLIRPRFEFLKNHTLELLHDMKTPKGNLTLLTFPKITGGHATLENNKELVFSAYKSIAKIKSNDISRFIGKSDDPKIVIGKDLKLSRIFARIDDDKVLSEVFKWIDHKLKYLSPEDGVLYDFLYLKELVIKNKCFSNLKKKLDYSLMHGDFHQGNMLLSQDGNSLFLIDWPNMYVAPKGVDLTKMFRRESWDFNRIKKEFLCDQELNADMDILEKCVFVFCMILTWLNFTPRKSLDNYENYIGPAVTYIKDGTQEFVVK